MMMPDPKSRDEANGIDETGYVKAAFKWQYNLIGLAGTAAFAVLSSSELPLILGAGLELIYLAAVPQMSRFQRLVRSWKYAEEKRGLEARLRALFNEIPPEMRVRYGKVETLCGCIRENYARLSSTTQIFARDTADRLDGLLQGYLRLLHALQQHYEYLRNTDVERIKKEAAELQRSMSSDPPRVQEINRKRIEILAKRIEKFGKICENRSIIEAQCGAMEDVLQLIRDQSVTLRDPQQVNDQLDGLVHDVEQTEQTVREVASILDLAAPDTFGVSGSGMPGSSGDSATRPGNRMRN
jgi:hypothetical protein